MIVVGAGLAGLVAAAEVADAGRSVLLLDQEGEQSLGGQAFWSLGGLFFVDSPEQRRMGIKDSHELALQDWMGSAQFDREEDRWPRALGRGVRRLRGRREALVAARDGPPALPDRRLGRARRRPGRRARQLGAAVPHHLGDRPGRRRRRSSGGSASTSPPAGSRSRFRHRVDGLVVDGGTVVGVQGHTLAPDDADRGRPTNRDEVGDFELRGAGGDRHQRRHRRQPRPGPQGLAGAARHAAADDGRRRTGPRRRPDARHHRGGRRTGDQPGPDVALRRGAAQLGPDLGEPRHPDPARPVVAVAGRRRAAGCRRRTSRASTPSAPCATCARPATTTRGSC